MFHLVVIAVLAGSALAAPKSNPFIHVDPTLSPGQFVGGDNRYFS